MNVPTIATPSPFQLQTDHNIEESSFEPPTSTETSVHRAFVLRSAQVDRLIDEKIGYIMESARLRSLAKASTEQSESILAIVQELEGKISHLQEQIDRELKGLFYSLQKAPAPSPFLDELPG